MTEHLIVILIGACLNSYLRKTFHRPFPVKKIWIGIETGGTFTDLVLCELTTGRYTYHKLPTTTGDPAKAVLDGIAEVIELAQLPRDEVEFLVLGTTLGTNAVLEGKTARTGMITTAGFRDVIELARQRRPHYFNLDILKPTPPALPWPTPLPG